MTQSDRKPPANVSQPRAVKRVTAAVKEGKTAYGRERWHRIACIIDRTNAARSEIADDIAGVDVPPELASLSVIQHLPKMPLHDASSVDLLVQPPVERCKLDLSLRLHRRLVSYAMKLGVPVDIVVEQIFQDPQSHPLRGWMSELRSMPLASSRET